MIRLIKKIFIVVILFVMIILVGESKASLQANPNTHYKGSDVLNNWFYRIRNMEKAGEAMGLNETLNEDLTPSSDSNKIDVHLMRSTEYGAIAILSASGYGNPQTLQESTIKTTTGNKTGIYLGENFEWVAAGNDGESAVDGRYYDIYTLDNKSARVGDALGNDTTPNPGCAGWHGGSSSWGTLVSFVRGNGVFSYYHGYSYNSNYGWYISPTFARGVAVCGEGL